MTMRNGWAAVLLAAAAALPAGAGCAKHDSGGKPPAPRAVVSGVEVATVRASAQATYIEAVATVRARATAQVAPQMMGRITNVFVSEGSRVEKGARLATIDDAAVRAQAASAEGAVAEAGAAREEALRAVAQALAARTLAEKTHERFRRLHEEKVVTGQEYDEAEAKRAMAAQEYERAVERRAQADARIAGARAQADAARAILSYATVTAPFAGIVTGKMADAGSMAVPGAPILVVEDTSRYRIEAGVPEAYLGAVKVGQPIEALVESLPGQPIAARVTEIVPAVDPGSRTFTVRADIAGKGLRTGLFGRIRLATGAADILTIPKRAIVRAAGADGAFVITPDNVARLVLIRTGREAGDAVELLSGIDPGARVAVSAVDRLVDGAAVEIKP